MRVLASITLIAGIVAVMSGGTAPFGRVLLSWGMPAVAVHSFDDPAWLGVALLRAGHPDAAAQKFAEAGHHFNLGVAETFNGRYAAALEAFDRADTVGHPDARANFDLVAAFYAGLGIDAAALGLFGKRKEGAKADSDIARGNARAAGTGSEVNNTNTMLGLAQLDTRGQLGVRRVFDDKFIVADDRWLEQLSDVPGEYMAARIRHEYKRRVKQGISPEPPEDPR